MLCIIKTRETVIERGKNTEHIPENRDNSWEKASDAKRVGSRGDGKDGRLKAIHIFQYRYGVREIRAELYRGRNK
jgi:hypothetical protein